MTVGRRAATASLFQVSLGIAAFTGIWNSRERIRQLDDFRVNKIPKVKKFHSHQLISIMKG